MREFLYKCGVVGFVLICNVGVIAMFGGLSSEHRELDTCIDPATGYEIVCAYGR